MWLVARVSGLRARSVWDLSDHRAEFRDIFFSNCTKNGLLPVILTSDICAAWRSALHTEPGLQLEVDLDSLLRHGLRVKKTRFLAASNVRERMLAGLDEVGITREFNDQIIAFEAAHKIRMPWAFSAPD